MKLIFEANKSASLLYDEQSKKYLSEVSVEKNIWGVFCRAESKPAKTLSEMGMVTQISLPILGHLHKNIYTKKNEWKI